MACIIDILNILSWQWSGTKAEKPKSMLDMMNGTDKKESNIQAFNSKEDFKNALKKKNEELKERS